MRHATKVLAFMAMAQHTLLVQAKPVKTSSSCRDDAPPLPVISTTSGDFLPYYDYTTSTANGTSSSTTFPDVASFLDIPYAENPTGPLRFSAPVAYNPASSNDSSSAPAPVQATKLPGGCFQLYPSNFIGTVMDEAERGFDLAYGDYSETTEDCLRLSVFAPKTAVEDAAASASTPSTTDHTEETAGGGLPVLIFVHGGGYSFGGIDVAYQLSPSWVQRSQKHIVVQIQYRLNLLGVPGAAALVSSPPSSISDSPNLSLLDQRLAIEWVRDNIAHFGGDASRITLWGQSAGAYAVDAYRYAEDWSSDPIVGAVIADSGNAVAMGVNSLQWPGNSSMFSYAASQLGCGGGADGPLDPEAELECMRAVPADMLKDYIQNRAPADGLSFSTVVDNVTVFADYSDPSLIPGDSAGAKLPTLIGTTTEEGGAVVPYDFEGSETATQLPADEAVIADAFRLGVQCTTLEEVRLRSDEEDDGKTTYQYLYAGNFTDISPRPWLGAYHTAELPLIFGTVGLQGSASSYEEKATRWAQDAWLAFAKDPVSGLKDEFGWAPAAGVNGSTVMVWAEGDEQIGRSTSVGDLRQECVGNGYAV